MEATVRHPTSRYLLVLLLLVAGVLLFARAMDRDLNHDEHQFLSPGALLVRQGMLPYRDYPLFHVPNLTYIYGSLLRVTDHYVLGAKVLSVVSSFAVLGVILIRAARRSPFGSPSWTIPMGAALAVLFITDPLFLWTAGKTWNHELPTMFLVVAYICQLAAVQKNSLLFSGFAGFLVSLAVGTRLTIAPAVLPFIASFGIVSNISVGRRFAMLASFAAAGVLAAAPSLLSLFTSREAFLFGNLECPRLRLLDPEDSRAAETITWWRKFRYFVKEVILIGRKDDSFRGSILIFLPFAALAIPFARSWFRSLDPARFPGAFATTLVVFLGLGCAFPTRYQYQHWFIIVPFLILAIAESLHLSTPGARSWKPWALSILATVSLAMNGIAYAEPLRILPKPGEWFPVRLHTYGKEISSHIPHGKVLTLAPAYVDEAGLLTYPIFATGCFAWRLAHLVDPNVRERFHLIAPTDLESYLANDRPAAILTGVEEDELEAPLVDYAKARGYQRVKLKKDRVLWVPPNAESATTPIEPL
ncbi:MAG TPA: hypothetical protein VFG14_12640 [Chthoniobacteraceae bacterium]|nr:hypothetical protein [Chthoniobacteraceae bacterium]